MNGVDLVFPLNEDKLPNEDGILTIAVPSGEGWEYIPVSNNDGKVIYYTFDLGDPIIAWHFIKSDEQINYYREQMQKELTICDPYIDLEISPTSGIVGTEIQINGQVLPLRGNVPNWQENWGNLFNLKLAANIPVYLSFGSSYLNSIYGEITLKTDEKWIIFNLFQNRSG